MRLLKNLQYCVVSENITRAGTATPWLLPCPDICFYFRCIRRRIFKKRTSLSKKIRAQSQSSPLNRALTTA
jgi:hypothetical protein